MRLTSNKINFREVTELTYINVQGLLYYSEVIKGYKYKGKSPKGADLRKEKI
jgi:hypothetical protein